MIPGIKSKLGANGSSPLSAAFSVSLNVLINVKNSRLFSLFAFLLLVFVLLSSSLGCKPNSPPACDAAQLKSAGMFSCNPYKGLAPVEEGPAITYQNSRLSFPQDWQQLGYNQAHQTAFPIDVNSPQFLKNGVFWAAPLTGLDYHRFRRARINIPDAGGQVWARIMATTLGAIMGPTVAQGIVFTQQSDNTLNALDAETGELIWQRELVNVGGMGQVVAGNVNGRLVLFVGTGDAGFTVENVIRFTNGQQHDRGAGFSTLYAFDGAKGTLLWQLNTKGASRVAPLYLEGMVYLATAGGKFHAIDATNGQIVGSLDNPGGGFPGLCHLNWYRTSTGRLLVFYGTLRPRYILAIDATDPTTLTLAWQAQPTGATKNSPGDTPVVVDQTRGLLVTTVFTNAGKAAEGLFDLRVLALDANTGIEVWNNLSGEGPSIPGFKASVPMIHENRVYFGNALNETYQAYDLDSGALVWSTWLPGGVTDSSINSFTRNRPSGASVYYKGKIIQAQGDNLRTIDAATGAIENVFKTPLQTSATWAVIQPVIVGNQMYISSLSGWVFAIPMYHVMNKSGVRPRLEKPNDVPKRQPEFESAVDRPDHTQVAQFADTWDAFAGGQEHNSVVEKGPTGVNWTAQLNNHLLLTDPARDVALYGAEIATLMTHWAFGVGTGVSPAKGMLYVGSDRFTINAFNAITGDLVWRHRTPNFNFGQPIVTFDRVIVSAGDPWMTLGLTGPFKQKVPKADIGERLPVVTGLDPLTGEEKWSVFSSTGTSAMTPLLWDGKIFFVSGEGMLWGVYAVNGTMVGKFIKPEGFVLTRPLIDLGGFNAISSANIYNDASRPLMIVGTASPNKMTAIDLSVPTEAWTQDFPGVATHLTGFAATSPAVSQAKGITVGSVFVDVDYPTNVATLMAFALDARTGDILWTTPIGTGSVPADIVASTPVISATHAYFNSPLSNSTVALDLDIGAIEWQTTVSTPAGKNSWGPGVLFNNKLIQPIGPNLVTFNAATGAILNTLSVGGSFTFNHPTIAGRTLYIGNSWGHVHAFPVGTVTGDAADNL